MAMALKYAGVSAWSQVESRRWWAAGACYFIIQGTIRLFFILMRISNDVERERECEVHRQ